MEGHRTACGRRERALSGRGHLCWGLMPHIPGATWAPREVTAHAGWPHSLRTPRTFVGAGAQRSSGRLHRGTGQVKVLGSGEQVVGGGSLPVQCRQEGGGEAALLDPREPDRPALPDAGHQRLCSGSSAPANNSYFNCMRKRPELKEKEQPAVCAL